MSLPFHRGQISTSNNRTNRSHRGGSRERGDEAARNLLEQENDRKWDDLGAQVTMLKSV